MASNFLTMANDYLNSAKKQFEYYKNDWGKGHGTVDRTFCYLFYQFNFTNYLYQHFLK